MKQILVFLLITISSLKVSGNDGYKRNLTADIIHYDFSISVSDSNNVVYGHSEILVSFTANTDSLVLDLKNKGADGKGMQIRKLTFNDITVNWKHVNSRIVLKFSNSIQKGSQGIVLIDYFGIPSDGLIISNNKYGDRTFFADNWPDRGHNWLPCVDHPYDKATVDFIVTAPDHYEVVGSGYLVEESCLPNHYKLTHWKEDVPLAVKVMAIGIADFASRLEGNAGNIPVWSWVYRENRNEGFNDYAIAMKPLAFYCSIIGPYSYEKLANVQSKTIFGGLENAGCIFYAESSVTGKGKTEDLMAHEIAHQWFGNSVTEDDWHHIWLSEGFATYMTAVYQEKTYGKEKLDETMRSARDRVIRFSMRAAKPVIDTTVTDLMRLLNANSYQKGAWVLHMLRRKIGDDHFWTGMRKFYEIYRNRNALTSDFQDIMEKESQTSLNDFFQQWLYTAGQPVLKISYTKSQEKDHYDIIIEQTQQHLFTFEIEIETVDASGSQYYKLPVSDRITRKTIKTQKIINIIPDPDVNLLFRDITEKDK